mmetsp:Transcript_21111/g.57702  ORF Transcript_21111/g.57702 Transcript_21111/m.57702 type:complete len:210 (+) Transcript_21111:1653-2282(+)
MMLNMFRSLLMRGLLPAFRKCSMNSAYLMRGFPPAIALNTASISSKQASSLIKRLLSVPGKTHRATTLSRCTALINSSSEIKPLPSTSMVWQIRLNSAVCSSSSALPTLSVLPEPAPEPVPLTLVLMGLRGIRNLEEGEAEPIMGEDGGIGGIARLPGGSGGAGVALARRLLCRTTPMPGCVPSGGAGLKFLVGVSTWPAAGEEYPRWL